MLPTFKPKLLLKARPTEAQIADRLREPVPDGLELYLDDNDIKDDGWQERLVAMIQNLRPEWFDFVVEGPLRSLDGDFFDVTSPSSANMEVIDRLTSLGAGIGAQAAVIHVMAARRSATGFTSSARDVALEQAIPLLRHYVTACRNAGIVPTVENVPPVARMRETTSMFSLLGTSPGDILDLIALFPDLKVTLDVSHAQLYVNAFGAASHSVEPDIANMVEFLRSQSGVTSVAAYIDAVAPSLFEAHISNARGLLGEGLPYDDGELEMDATIQHLAQHAVFLVTETIEPDPNRAVFMREAQRRISQVIDRYDRGRDL